MSIYIEKFKAGRNEKGPGYSYFVPNPVNDQWEWSNPELNTLLERASIKLGELNACARLVPNIDLFIRLYVTKEAVISSRIEGTRTNIDEALLPVDEIAPERKDDWKEVSNYTRAMNLAIKSLEELPLSSRLIRNVHKILLDDVRGEHKMPGEFRSSQNWLGGRTLVEAVFIPPAHSYINDLMSDLEKFLHNDKINVPSLIRIGIAHYQFETIHPFLDGNGRIGRLLITLYLVNNGILSMPLLYLSVFFELNRGMYYDNLMKVRTDNDMLGWLKYFLTGIAQVAELSVATLSNVLDLQSRLESRIKSDWGRRADSGLALLAHLFKNPVLQVREVQDVCGLSYKAANDLVMSFEKGGILREITNQSRNRVFMFDEYVSLFD